MAFIMRSLAVIGIIALNSPTHDRPSAVGGRAQQERAGATVSGSSLAAMAGAIGQIDGRKAIANLSAAREAAEVIAGLDPQTRARLLAMTAHAGGGRHEARTRDGDHAVSR